MQSGYSTRAFLVTALVTTQLPLGYTVAAWVNKYGCTKPVTSTAVHISYSRSDSPDRGSNVTCARARCAAHSVHTRVPGRGRARVRRRHVRAYTLHARAALRRQCHVLVLVPVGGNETQFLPGPTGTGKPSLLQVPLAHCLACVSFFCSLPFCSKGSGTRSAVDA